MEEKERYVVIGIGVYDNEKKEFVNDFIKVLNQQDKKIKELEEENTYFRKEMLRDGETFTLSQAKVIDEINKENQQLKQQLHDLPKQIVEEMEKCYTESLVLKDKAGAWFYWKLNEILKKYGGGNE